MESLLSESEKVAVAKFENLSTLTMMCCPALLRISAFMCVPGWVGLGLGEKLSSWLGNFLQAMHREHVVEIASHVFLVYEIAFKCLEQLRGEGVKETDVHDVEHRVEELGWHEYP